MNRQQKQAVIADFKVKINGAKSVFIVDYKGLTVSQLQDFRKQLRSAGSTFKITKARLIKIAAQNYVDSDDFAKDLKGQIGLVFTDGEVSPVAGKIVDFAKDNETFKIISGVHESKILTKDEIVFFASLPTKDVLFARLAGALISPMAKLAYVLKEMGNAEGSKSAGEATAEN